MGSTVASVTNYLPLQLSFQSLQDFVIFILISDFITSYSWEFAPFISCYFYLACAWNYFGTFKLRMGALRAVFHSKQSKIFVEPKPTVRTLSRKEVDRGSPNKHMCAWFFQHFQYWWWFAGNVASTDLWVCLSMKQSLPLRDTSTKKNDCVNPTVTKKLKCIKTP